MPLSSQPHLLCRRSAIGVSGVGVFCWRIGCRCGGRRVWEPVAALRVKQVADSLEQRAGALVRAHDYRQSANDSYRVNRLS